MKIGKKFKYFSFAVLLGTLFTAKCDVVSAATTIATDGLPDTIEKGEVKYVFHEGVVTQDPNKSNVAFYAEDKDGKYQLYCSDRNNPNFKGSYTLVKGERLDYGLTQFLVKQDKYVSSLYEQKINSEGITESTTNSSTAVTLLNTWITQMGIWGYQGTFNPNELGGNLSYKQSENDSYVYKILSGTDVSTALLARNTWDTYVDPEIKAAKELNAKSPYDATMTMKVDGEWTKIDGSDNVKSGLITVSLGNADVSTGSAWANVYSLSFVNAPEGTKVYTEDGKEVTDLKSIPVSSKIYLVVPKSNKKEDYKFSVKANSTITYNAPYQYVDKVGGHQPSILVGPESKDLSASIEMTLAPDTALSVSNSIYFLGFLILISGVFVIYANVKTKEVSE